jgi:hypothetical protein
MNRTRSIQGRVEKYIQNLVIEPESNKLPGRHRHRCGDNVIVYLKKRYDDVDWINIAHDRVQWRTSFKMIVNLSTS